MFRRIDDAKRKTSGLPRRLRLLAMTVCGACAPGVATRARVRQFAAKNSVFREASHVTMRVAGRFLSKSC